MARVAALFTGGTISMTADPRAGGNVPTLGAADLLALAPGLGDIADVKPIDLGRTPASHFRFAELLDLADVLRTALADPAIDGAVVVQGTDTIEETSFLFDLVLDSPKPVVVTGAMRSASEPGYDGPANLADAVRCAAAPSLRGAGVVVVLAGTIHAADDVAKTHTSSLTTFQSPNAGPLGVVDRDQVLVGRSRSGRRHVSTTAAAERVHLITAVVGMDGALVDAARVAGADGFVVAATGSGNTSASLLEAATRAMEDGLPVVLASRCSSGRAGTAYAFPGGGATWVRAGALLAGSLSGPKARVALALGLGAGLARDGLSSLLQDPARTS
jgi:L-asparaginase